MREGRAPDSGEAGRSRGRCTHTLVEGGGEVVREEGCGVDVDNNDTGFIPERCSRQWCVQL